MDFFGAALGISTCITTLRHLNVDNFQLCYVLCSWNLSIYLNNSYFYTPYSNIHGYTRLHTCDCRLDTWSSLHDIITYCLFCFLTLGDICTWGFNCGDKFHNGEYLTANFFDFLNAMSMAIAAAKTEEEVDWLADMTQSLRKQYQKK